MPTTKNYFIFLFHNLLSPIKCNHKYYKCIHTGVPNLSTNFPKVGKLPAAAEAFSVAQKKYHRERCVMSNIPEGKDAQEFITRWDGARRNPEARQHICREYDITYQRARYWAQEIRAIQRELPSNNEPFQNKFLSGDGKLLRFELGDERKAVLVINDLQIPYHDPASLGLVIRVIEDIQPDAIILNGDIIDFYTISRFNPDPKRRLQLQDDIDCAVDILHQIRTAAPLSKRILVAGNHEDRLRAYLWAKASELSSLRDLDIRKQLRLDILGYDYSPYDYIVKINDVFKVEHGDSVSKHSGWTAKAMYEKRGGCGICAHSHRMGSHLKTTEGDTSGWWENGCLCDMNPEYVKEPNWQQSFAVITFIGGWFSVQQVPIIKHKFLFNDKLYGD